MKKFLVLIVSAFLFGCASSSYQIPKTSPEEQLAIEKFHRLLMDIKNNEIEIGTPRYKIINEYTCYGKSEVYGVKINKTITEYGTSEQWVLGNSGLYLYFENGELTAIQSDDR